MMVPFGSRLKKLEDGRSMDSNVVLTCSTPGQMIEVAVDKVVFRKTLEVAAT